MRQRTRLLKDLGDWATYKLHDGFCNRRRYFLRPGLKLSGFQNVPGTDHSGVVVTRDILVEGNAPNFSKGAKP